MSKKVHQKNHKIVNTPQKKLLFHSPRSFFLSFFSLIIFVFFFCPILFLPPMPPSPFVSFPELETSARATTPQKNNSWLRRRCQTTNKSSTNFTKNSWLRQNSATKPRPADWSPMNHNTLKVLTYPRNSLDSSLKTCGFWTGILENGRHFLRFRETNSLRIALAWQFTKTSRQRKKPEETSKPPATSCSWRP